MGRYKTHARISATHEGFWKTATTVRVGEGEGEGERGSARERGREREGVRRRGREREGRDGRKGDERKEESLCRLYVCDFLNLILSTDILAVVYSDTWTSMVSSQTLVLSNW